MLSGDCLWPIPPSFTLTYRDDFLLPVTPPQLVRVPYDLVPEAPVDLGAAIDIGDRSLWRGMFPFRSNSAEWSIRLGV